MANLKVFLLTFLIFSASLTSHEAYGIVGGDFALGTDLVAQSTVGLSNGCTGTLITDNIIMTAAHCLMAGQEIEVIFGLSFQEGIRVSTTAIAIHPSYSSTAGGGQHPDRPSLRPIHDIALIKLSTFAPTGFLPAPLGSAQDLVNGAELILAGFGQTAAQNGSFGRLKQVRTIFNFYNEDALEVVFGPTPGRSACRGDSGGPMYREVGDQIVVIGVTSRGFPALGACSGNGNYTEIEAHLNWIEETINEFN